MLVSKNPYVVEARQKLTSKNPLLALKTGEKFTQTYRLNSLIFIVEKYEKKLLFGFLRQTKCFCLCRAWLFQLIERR